MNALRRYRAALAGLVLLVAVQTVAVVWNPGGRMDAVPDRSTYRFNRFGYCAAYRLLGRLGYPVERNLQSLDLLPDRIRQLWLVNPMVPLEAKELRRLRAWVSAGGTLVCAFDSALTADDGTEAPDAFPELTEFRVRGGPYAMLGLLEAPGLVPPEPKVVDYAAGAAYGTDVVRIAVPHGARLEGNAADRWRSVRDEQGTVLARRPVGEGNLVVTSETDLFCNANLAREDNAVLIANLAHAAGGPIAFDEYHHGFRSLRSPGDALGVFGGKVGVYQLAVAATMMLVASSRRLGSPRRLKPPSRRSALEFVDSMAALYQLSGARDTALQSVGRGARRRLARRLGLPMTSSDEEIAARIRLLEPNGTLRPDEAIGLLARSAEPVANDAQLVAVARRLDDLGGGGRPVG